MSYSLCLQLSITWGDVKLHVLLCVYYIYCLRPEPGKINALLYKSSAREIVTSSHAFSSTKGWCGNPCLICKNIIFFKATQCMWLSSCQSQQRMTDYSGNKLSFYQATHVITCVLIKFSLLCFRMSVTGFLNLLLTFFWNTNTLLNKNQHYTCL